MNFQSVNNLRNRRYDQKMFVPTQYSIANYCTDNRRDIPPCMEDIFTASQQKNEMKNAFGEDLFINNLHLITDPLKKNLADSIITEDKMGKDTKEKVSKEPAHETPDAQTTMAGITSFFSGVFNILSSAMFKRPKSPVNYYDCVEHDSREMAPKAWQSAKTEDRDKNGHTNDQSSCNKSYKTNLNGHSPDSNITREETNMSDCRAAVAQCEDKLNRVRALLSSKTVPIPTRTRIRRPKRVFVEAGSVEDSFEDAFSPEDFVSVSNDSYVEYFSPPQFCDSEMYQTASPLVMTRKNMPENSNNDVQKNNSEEVTKLHIVEELNISTDQTTNVCKQEVVSSCEDKLSKLKALLLEKRKKNTVAMETVPEPVLQPLHERPKPKNDQVIKTKDKRFKNRNRSTSKRKKSKLRMTIDEDMAFANEIHLDEQSSVENSPSTLKPNLLNLRCNFFDEVRGRFRSNSVTDSEDSFQIVVADSPRLRRPSDCDSEDSFIVFEDSPDTCYTSNEVFCESDYESDTESDSDVSDSGCNMTALSHELTRTITNLADCDLYEDKCLDEVDCVLNCLSTSSEAKKLLVKEERKKNLPAKKVTFSTEPPKVHVMRVWAFAARQARAGHWEGYARDRERFKRRIADADMALSWVLKPQHRSRVVFQRFMPWWNAEKRREAAEKKLKEVAEKERSEAEQLKEVAEKENSESGELQVAEKEQTRNGELKEVAEKEQSRSGELKEVAGKEKSVVNGLIVKQDLNITEIEKNMCKLQLDNEISIKDCAEIIPLDDKLNSFGNNLHVKEVLNT